MKKIFFIALLALLLFSCNTVKQTSTTKIDTKTESTVKAKNSVDSTVNIVDKSNSVIVFK